MVVILLILGVSYAVNYMRFRTEQMMYGGKGCGCGVAVFVLVVFVLFFIFVMSY